MVEKPIAVITVSDKTGLPELVQGLAIRGWEIVSTGGTGDAIKAAGVSVTPVEEFTGVKPMMDGLLKTLSHPMVATVLADTNNPAHMSDLHHLGVVPVGLVVCNFYPFADAPSISKIDIGGPTLVRAAAKNCARVGVLVRPADYPRVLLELGESNNALSEKTRWELAELAFAETADFDMAVENWFRAQNRGS